MNIVGDAFTVGIVLLLLIAAVSFYLYTRLTQVEKHMNLLESILLDLKVATENSFMGFPGFAMPPSPMSGGGGKPGRAPAISSVSEEDMDGVLDDGYIPTVDSPATEMDGEEMVDEKELEKALETADIEAMGDGSGEIEADDLPIAMEIGGGGGGGGNAGSSDVRVVELSGDAQQVLLADKGVHVNKIEPQYETMSAKELKQLAHNRGVKGASKMSRVEIIDALRKKDSGVEDGIAASAAPSSFNSSTFFGDAAAAIDA